MAFKLGLRELKERDGDPSYRKLASRTRYSHTVLAQAVGGKSLPTWPVTSAFVQACGGDETEWRRRWLAASENTSARQGTATAVAAYEVEAVGGDSRLKFAADLERRLEKANLTRRALAGRAGYAHSTLSAVLAGHRLPRPELLSALLKTVNASPEEIDQWLDRRVRLGVADQLERLSNTSKRPAAETRRADVVRVGAVVTIGAVAITALVTTTATATALHLLDQDRETDASPPDVSSTIASVVRHLTPATTSGRDPAVLATVRESVAVQEEASIPATQAQPRLLARGSTVLVVCRVIDGAPVQGPADSPAVTTVWAMLMDGHFVPAKHLKPDPGRKAIPDCTEGGPLPPNACPPARWVRIAIVPRASGGDSGARQIAGPSGGDDKCSGDARGRTQNLLAHEPRRNLRDEAPNPISPVDTSVPTTHYGTIAGLAVLKDLRDAAPGAVGHRDPLDQVPMTSAADTAVGGVPAHTSATSLSAATTLWWLNQSDLTDSRISTLVGDDQEFPTQQIHDQQPTGTPVHDLVVTRLGYA